MSPRTISGSLRRTLRGLVLAPLLSLALLVGSFPASAQAPNATGATSSLGHASSTLPGTALDAPQTGRPAGQVTGRRTH